MPGDNVIKFGKAKKSLARQSREKTAAANRARFGQKKSAKELKKAMAEKLQAKLDAHKIEEPATDAPKKGDKDDTV
ncbi:DUF4169 family protein [Fretibacter rubidus]|uniref:DUF4169 family protein n=1 Tax=Fretibacter rubidus TaxID=570162 RepID=UPI00352BA302